MHCNSDHLRSRTKRRPAAERLSTMTGNATSTSEDESATGLHGERNVRYDVEGLREEWDLILKNSLPGTRILMRSASPEIDFIPLATRERLRFFDNLTDSLHAQDRVGTYGSTLLAEVQ